MNVKDYIFSQSARIGYIAGIAFYLAYGLAFGALENLGLIATSLFIGSFLPFYSRISNSLEEKIQFKTATVTPGRLVRFIIQSVFNFGIFMAFALADVVPNVIFNSISNIAVMAAMTSLCSQGFQYLAMALSNREIGNKNLNIVVSLLFSILLTCAAVIGFSVFKTIFTYASFGLGGIVLTIGILSDIRAQFYPQGGVGVFFGTFNPLHRTHIELIRKLIQTRNVEKIYVHATVIPKLHRDALRKNEIQIAKYENGMRVYARTGKADPHVNYFPTGHRFFEYSTRHALLNIQIQEVGLSDKVEILSLPAVYDSKGFYGVMSHINQLHPNQPIHGIHGSDLGGMWVRSIYDDCGWIYPMSVCRVDGVSATAIRNGVRGMMTSSGEQILDFIKSGTNYFIVENRKYSFKNGVLNHETV